MLKKINNKYIITNYITINDITSSIKNTNQLNDLKISDFTKYIEIMNILDKIPVLREEYTAEEIIYINFDMLDNLTKYIDIKPQIADIKNLMFKLEDLLIVPQREAEIALKKNPDYRLINLFQLHDYAEELRFNIAIPVSSTILIQKHGMYPVTDFIKIPAPKASIIQIMGSSYFSSENLYKIYPDLVGVNPGMKKVKLVQVEGIYSESKIINRGTTEVYETLDGVNYRKLITQDKNIDLLSEIAYGYNYSSFVEPVERKKIDLKKTEEVFIQKYRDIIAKINPSTYEENKKYIIKNIISELSELKYDKFLEREFRLALQMEELRMGVIIRNTDKYLDFKYEVLNKDKNFILKFIKKIKINEYRKEISRQTSQNATSYD